ncbi:MAG: hypothetical protein PQJ46_15425 [Spirochaetales bacterium]|nr:hypothetical protein [Spirochaetales bacterium]
MATDLKIINFNGDGVAFAAIPEKNDVLFISHDKIDYFSNYCTNVMSFPKEISVTNDGHVYVLDKVTRKVSIWVYDGQDVSFKGFLSDTFGSELVGVCANPDSQFQRETNTNDMFLLNQHKIIYNINGNTYEFDLSNKDINNGLDIMAPENILYFKNSTGQYLILNDKYEGKIIKYSIKGTDIVYEKYFKTGAVLSKSVSYKDIGYNPVYDEICLLDSSSNSVMEVFSSNLDSHYQIKFEKEINAIDFYDGDEIKILDTTSFFKASLVTAITEEGSVKQYYYSTKDVAFSETEQPIIFNLSQDTTFYFDIDFLDQEYDIKFLIQPLSALMSSGSTNSTKTIDFPEKGSWWNVKESLFDAEKINNGRYKLTYNANVFSKDFEEGPCRVYILKAPFKISDRSISEYIAIAHIDLIADYKLDNSITSIINNIYNLNIPKEKLDTIKGSVHELHSSLDKKNYYINLMKILENLNSEEILACDNYKLGEELNSNSFYINYKDLTKNEIVAMASSHMNILSSNQGDKARKIKEISKIASKNFGYADGAGVSSFETRLFYWDENSKTAYLKDSNGNVIPESSEWFIRDGNHNYCKYWNGTGYMMHISNSLYQNWFFENRISPLIKDFDGVFLDDVWSNVYNNTVVIDGDGVQTFYSNDTSDWLGDSWLTDYSASWSENEYAGKILACNGQKIEITGNSKNTLWFNKNDLTKMGSNFAYKIISVGNSIYQDQVVSWLPQPETYSDSMIKFLGKLKHYLENKGKELIINMWLEKDYLTTEYANNANYIVNEALTHTWDMNNFVTKQFLAVDYYEAEARLGKMTKHKNKTITISYPHNQQSYLELIGVTLLLSKYDKKDPKLLVTGSNINLSQLYVNRLQTVDFGSPLGEHQMIKLKGRDYYLRREFKNAWVLYNPSRHGINVADLNDYNGIVFPVYKDIQSYKSSDKPLYIPQRSCLFIAKDGTNFFKKLEKNMTYCQLSDEEKFISFTSAGKEKIGSNSVWINGGYSNNKNLIMDGTGVIPKGETIKLFHAGNGQSSSVKANDLKKFSINGVKEFVMSPDSISKIIKIFDSSTLDELKANVDYTITYRNLTFDEEGVPKWDTRVTILNSNFYNKNLTILYIDRNSADDTSIFCQQEHGILINNEPKLELITGGIDYVDCNTSLIENVDYYALTEETYRLWDYSASVNTSKNKIIFNTKDYNIDMGHIEPESLIVVSDELNPDSNEFNGHKLDIKSSDIEIYKPRILYYGFREDVRYSDSGKTIPSLSRQINNYTPASLFKKDEGVFYDRVIVTGDYDEFGSINGFVKSDENDIGGIDELSKYFDVVIIGDTFQELGTDKELSDIPSQPAQDNDISLFKSWLKDEDYNFIKKFDNLLIDQRGGLLSFEWNSDRSNYVKNTLPNLKNKFGVSSIAGEPVDSSNYVILWPNVQGVSDNHIKIGEAYNHWENNGKYASYVPFGSFDTTDGYHKVFSIEKSTGRPSGVAFYKYNKTVPNILWLGVSFTDMKYLIDSWIGVRVEFKNISKYSSGSDFKVLYNQYTDQLSYRNKISVE